MFGSEEEGRWDGRYEELGTGLGEGKLYSRVEDMGGVVHAFLKSTVCVGEGLCGGAEAHVLAEVVAALGTIGAVVAHDACLDRYSLTGDEVLDTGADSSDDASCFVAENEGSLYDEVAVTSVSVVVH